MLTRRAISEIFDYEKQKAKRFQNLCCIVKMLILSVRLLADQQRSETKTEMAMAERDKHRRDNLVPNLIRSSEVLIQLAIVSIDF